MWIGAEGEKGRGASSGSLTEADEHSLKAAACVSAGSIMRLAAADIVLNPPGVPATM